MKQYRKIFPYIRGSIFSFMHLTSNSLICQMGKVHLIKEHAKITIGTRTTIWPHVKISCVGTPERTANLTIGEKCSIGDQTQIHCGDSISIGSEVIIAWSCNILDRDYHNISGGADRTAPVKVGNRVWVGCNAIILKGVTIGDGAIVAAGSVVTKNVPPHTLVAGNPAVIKKEVTGWK